MRRPSNRRLTCARARRTLNDWRLMARLVPDAASLTLAQLKDKYVQAVLKEIYSVSLVSSVTTDGGLMKAFECGEAQHGGRVPSRGRYIEAAHYFDLPAGVAVTDRGRFPVVDAPVFANPKMKLVRVVEPLE